MTQDRICIFRDKDAVSICGKPATVTAELTLTDSGTIHIADDVRLQSIPLCSPHASLLTILPWVGGHFSIPKPATKGPSHD